MIRSLICALALASSTTAALACGAHTEQTQSCAPGTSWDAVSHSCKENVSG
ncbi:MULTISPECIES: adenylosuccinate lyase [Ruegeria]|uniref:adenylosuccinate lyase n=1 Tax=Ruegeria TaxID=97050 RepID=UPI001480562A|nr:adenylosuccinate lyase [Ruegeria lacuscaerulensis]